VSIYINESASPEFFYSRHFIAYSLGEGESTIVRSGIVLLPNESQEEAEAAGRPWARSGFKGSSESDWRGDQVILELDLTQAIARLNPPPPDPPNSWGFTIDQWAPIASLNSIYNAGVSNYAGYSVNTFQVDQGSLNAVILKMDIAARDTDGYLYRVGFYVTLVGRLVQVTPTP
jgi:hypothetical protein